MCLVFDRFILLHCNRIRLFCRALLTLLYCIVYCIDGFLQGLSLYNTIRGVPSAKNLVIKKSLKSTGIVDILELDDFVPFYCECKVRGAYLL